MSFLVDGKKGNKYLLMGNEAIARGALEAGISVAAGYPGTPSSEIIENLAKAAEERNVYVEWSVNEKVAMEVAASAAFAGLRSICTVKQNGVHVASDFFVHLAYSGIRGGMLLILCEDPGAISSINEVDSRYFAKMLEVPLLEPGDFQEAKDMAKWGLELSDEIKSVIMFRSVTRLSHASGNVIIDSLPSVDKTAYFDCHGPVFSDRGPIISAPVPMMHTLQQNKMKKVAEIFEESPFNTYRGPEKPELLIITSSACYLYSIEAVHVLGLGDRVGILKLGTTWPLPPKLIKKHLSSTDNILIIEEVISFMEENIKVLAADFAGEIGVKKFYGKNDGTLPSTNEMNPDILVDALKNVLGIEYTPVPEEYEKNARILAFTKSPNRELTFCPGCPHRASFWSINNVLKMDNRGGFVCGDIGCYTMAILPTGFSTVKTVHAMGSGTGTASGFGKLRQFNMDQPVLSVCGDSTFFHAAMPALVNAVHHKSDITMVILDNSGTAMTGFQPHPGLDYNVTGEKVPSVDIAEVCRAIGARVEVRDPFELEETQNTLMDLFQDTKGAKVLILKQPCSLSPERKGKKNFEMSVNEEICIGENCGCNRLCTRIFRCPGLVWDKEKKVAHIDEVICTGCGVCASICPAGAITKVEVQ